MSDKFGPDSAQIGMQILKNALFAWRPSQENPKFPTAEEKENTPSSRSILNWKIVVQIQNVSIYNSNSNLAQEPITLVMGSCLEKMT